MAAGQGSFQKNLWNKFDQCYDRVTAGRHDVKQFRAYCEARASIEDAYARALEKLAQDHDFETGGSIAKCWTDVREATRRLATQHSELGNVLQKQIGGQLETTMKEIKKKKTEAQKQHEKLLQDLKRKEQTHERAKQRYYTAVKDAENAVVNRDAGIKEKLPDSNLKKLEGTVKKCLKEVDASHGAYKKAVQELKEAQEKYDQETAVFLQQFEEIERDRIRVLMDQFGQFSQCHQFLKSAIDQITLVSDKGVKEVDVEKDLQEFIAASDDHQQPPPHVVYEPLPSEIINHARGPSEATPAAAAVAPKSYSGTENKKGPAINASGRGGAGAAGGYSGGGASGGGDIAIAQYDFDAQQDGDLPFKLGDRIRVLDRSDADWWRGELNGRQGMFPATYVEVAGAGGSSAADGAGAAASADQPRLVEGKCEALYDFVAQGSDELSFKAGDILLVTGELNGWYLGKTMDGSRVGIFPSNYVTMMS